MALLAPRPTTHVAYRISVSALSVYANPSLQCHLNSANGAIYRACRQPVEFAADRGCSRHAVPIQQFSLVSQRQLEDAAHVALLGRADDEHLSGGVDDLSGDGVERVDVEDALARLMATTASRLLSVGSNGRPTWCQL